MGKKLNQRGILITFSVFLLVLAILFFNSTITENAVVNEQQTERALLQQAGQKFHDIERSLLDLDLSGQKKILIQAGLPFSYSGDGNSLLISQYLPLFSATLSTYFNSLNGYRIFFLQQAKQDLPAGFQLDINTTKDQNWGGTANKAGFLLEPYCIQYDIFGSRLFLGQSLSGRCLSSFYNSALRRADINVTIQDVREDFNSLTCNGANCPQNAFDAANPNPYYNVHFITSGCPNCNLPTTTVSLHQSVGSDYNIFLSCTSSACQSEPFQLMLNNLVRADRNSAKYLKIDLLLAFDQNIQSFRALDLNFAVRMPQYGIVRTSDFTGVG